MATCLPSSSTNVRSDSPLDPWPRAASPAPRAPAAGLVAWIAFVAAAGADGVFARLDPAEYLALAIFVTSFFAVAAWVDAESRAALDRLSHPLWAALATDGLVIAAAAAVPRLSAGASWSSLPGVLALLVALPLALVFHVAALRRPRL